MNTAQQTLLDVAEAQAIVLEHVRPLDAIEVSLADSLFYTLARPLTCDIDYPPFDRSLMDGYAVRAQDTGSPPVTLRVTGALGAGSNPSSQLASGEAIQINTGAVIPLGADSVVRVEDTEFDAAQNRVLIRIKVEAGQFITKKASYVSANQVVLHAGQRMGPLEIAVAASSGAAMLPVHRKPNIACLCTGNELVEVSVKPTGAQIRNSNQYMLDALVRSTNFRAINLGVVPDDPAKIRAKIAEGLDCDVLCITGGISMGAFDHVPAVLEASGARVHFRKMAIKPGRPTLFATTESGKLIFALPGNPISAFVGFELLVRPAIAKLQGQAWRASHPPLARLRGTLGSTSARRSFRPGWAEVADDGQWEVSPLSWQGSGDPFGMAGANVLIEQPPESPALGVGELVAIRFVGL